MLADKVWSAKFGTYLEEVSSWLWSFDIETFVACFRALCPDACDKLRIPKLIKEMRVFRVDLRPDKACK
jgi:hypothetical protein